MGKNCHDKHFHTLKADSLQKGTDSGKSDVTLRCEQFSDEELVQLEEAYIYEEDFISDVSNDLSWSSIVQVADGTTCKSPRMQKQHILLSPDDNKLSSESYSSIKAIDDSEKKSSSQDIRFQSSDKNILDAKIQNLPHIFYTKKDYSLLSKRSKYSSCYQYRY